MELYVLAGGQIDNLNRWQQDLNSQFLPIYKNGKRVKFEDGGLTHRRLLVAPVQLYKIAFAKEELQNVVNMVVSDDYISKRYKIFGGLIKFFRRVIGLKSIPKPTFKNPMTQPNQVDKNIFILPIGLKEDMFNKDGEEQI